MKIFLITITILGAIIYGMLQLNEHYDDKGACGWSLFHGGYYKHKERLDKAIEGLIEDIIKHDKEARRALMIKQGKSEADINQTLKKLEPQYQKEREKIQKYCHLDFEKEPYFQKKSMRVKPSEYCEIGNGNNGGKDWLFPYTSLSVEYNFDKESLDLFNTKRVVGIVYDTLYYPCRTRYQGLGETGHLLVR